MRLDEATQIKLQAEVKEIKGDWVRDQRFSRIEAIDAISCKNKTWDPTPSREDAVAQLKFKALSLGGTAIGTVVCERPEGTNLVSNCWSSIRCNAVALREGDPARAESAAPRRNNETFASAGSGFFVASNLVVTNHHVVEGCASVGVRGQTMSSPGRVILSDRTNDLAVVRTDRPGTPLALRGDQPIRRGEAASVVGYPLGGLLSQGATVATGSVSALSGIGGDSRVLQISAPVQQGNSGGPVIDGFGHVIGVVQGKLNALAVAAATGDIPQNVNFAIKASGLKEFLAETGEPLRTGQQGRPLLPADAVVPALASTVQVLCQPGNG